MPESIVGKKISQFDPLAVLNEDEFFLVEDALGIYKKILASDIGITAQLKASVLLNSMKVTNQIHSGHIEGGLQTRLQSTAITDQPLEAPVCGDFALISDSSDASNLKKVDVDSFLNTQAAIPVNRMRSRSNFWPQPGQH